jgi:hypothetical protein
MKVLGGAIELPTDSRSGILTIKVLTMAEPIPARPEGGQIWHGTTDVLIPKAEDLNRSTESRRI